jgi:enamine deaminase RidA (YjgF/YER057c/UK114 family)
VTLGIRPLTGDGSPPVEGAYPQAVEVTAATRWLYLSGQIPVAPDGSLAPDFIGQCEQVWSNIETQLAAAGMTLDNLVKVTTFLSDRRNALENREVRIRRLAGRQPALTVIVTGLFDETWLVEIEAVAAA